MKKILSFLMMIVFLQAQVFAMSGGPTYGATGENIVGSYSGVLIPNDGEISAVTGPNGELIPSLGIFSLKVPVTGYATGIFMMFSEGQTFPGTINAVGNALKGTLSGLLEASFDTNISQIVGAEVVTVSVTTSVNGTLEAKVSATQGIASRDVAGLTVGSTFQRVTGTAVLVYDQGQVNDALQPIVTNVLHYTVDGVKQSGSVSTTDTTGTGTGGTTTGA
jgi:hypothetical protein